MAEYSKTLFEAQTLIKAELGQCPHLSRLRLFCRDEHIGHLAPNGVNGGHGVWLLNAKDIEKLKQRVKEANSRGPGRPKERK